MTGEDEFDQVYDIGRDASYLRAFEAASASLFAKQAVAAVPVGDPTAAAVQGGAPPQPGMPPGGAPPQAAAPPPPQADPAAMQAMADQATAMPSQQPLTADDVKNIVTQAMADNAVKPAGGAGGGSGGGGKGAKQPDPIVQAMSTDAYHVKTMLTHLFRHLGIEAPDLKNPYRDPNTGLPITAEQAAPAQAGAAPAAPAAPVKQAAVASEVNIGSPAPAATKKAARANQTVPADLAKSLEAIFVGSRK